GVVLVTPVADRSFIVSPLVIVLGAVLDDASCRLDDLTAKLSDLRSSLKTADPKSKPQQRSPKGEGQQHLQQHLILLEEDRDWGHVTAPCRVDHVAFGPRSSA